jgi:hypothetical protein
LIKDRIKAVFYFYRRGRTPTGANGGVFYFVRYIIKPITLATESRFSKIQPFLLTVFIVFLLFPNSFCSTVGGGIDASYNIAINLAWKYHLVFGKDFVFTFGPLGVLNYRISLAVPGWVYLFFDVYGLVTLIHILFTALGRRRGLLPAVFLVLAFLPQVYGAIYDRYFLFFLFYLFSYIKKPDNTLFLIQAAVLSLLSFYFKVNPGVTAIALFTVMVIYMPVINKISPRRGIIILGGYFLALVFFSWLLHVDLKGYVTSSFHLIDSYNDAMYLPLQPRQFSPVPLATGILLLSGAITLYFWVLSVYKRELEVRRDEIFIFALMTVVLFIYCKEAFVREDAAHAINFFKISSLFAALLYLFSPVAERKPIGVSAWLILYASYLSLQTFSGDLGRVIPSALLAMKVRNIRTYFSQLATYSKDRDPGGPVNSELKKLIGDHSIDVIPWEISKVYFNRLHYDPRPVIQSYSAYDNYLDSLNAAKYLAADAPDYILFSVNSIDDRYPFFDESKTKLAIFSHYAVVKQLDADLILRKRNREDLIESAAVMTSGKIGEDIPVPEGAGLVFSKITVHYSFMGQVRRLFFQPPPLRITLTLQDNKTMSYRAIPSMLADGAIVNCYIGGLLDFRLLTQSAGRSYTPVRKIRLDVDSGGTGFANEIQLSTVHYTFPHQPDPERLSDSLGFVHLMDQYKPFRRDSAFFRQDTFYCQIDEQESRSPFILIDAWAYRSGVPYKEVRETAVLKAGNTVYELQSEPEYREDLALALPKQDSSTGAGFVARVGKSQLPAGRYQLGILLADTLRKEQWVRYTDHEVVVP